MMNGPLLWGTGCTVRKLVTRVCGNTVSSRICASITSRKLVPRVCVEHPPRYLSESVRFLLSALPFRAASFCGPLGGQASSLLFFAGCVGEGVS